MNKKDLENMLGMVDDKYLKEANPTKKSFFVLFNKSLFMKIATVAACFVLVLNAVLFPALIGAIGGLKGELNNKDAQINNILDRLEKEENTPHTQQIYELNLGQMGGTPSKITLSTPQTKIPNEYKDIVELLATSFEKPDQFEDFVGEMDQIQDAIDKSEGSLDGWLEKEDSEWLPGGATSDKEDQNATDGETSNGEYEETTDLQTNGVIEADIIKRTSKYIYHLNGDVLNIYSIDGLNSKCVGSASLGKIITLIDEKITISGQLSGSGDYLEDVLQPKADAYEMYLSKDGSVVTVVVSDHFSMYQYETPYVALISVNVKDPKDIFVTNVATLYGQYESSRVIDDEIFVFTKHNAKKEPLAIPQYSDGDGFRYFDIDNIYTEGADTSTYFLTYRLNGTTLKMNDASAFLSFGEEVYVSETSIYVTKSFREKREGENKRVTEILRISYENGKFEKIGTIVVDGYIKDRYSLSEYDGYLRVVTTDTTCIYFEKPNYTMYPTSASLFIIDAFSMRLVNSNICFAPKNETVRSVKFKDQYAYVCTSIQTKDPVFFFDLSDISGELEPKQTEEIPGFSTSLIDFGEDLLGVGVDANWNFKLEAYRETETGVESVDYYIVNGSYSTEYKAYYINRELGLFGLGVYDRNSTWPNRYLLLHYNGNGFVKVLNEEMHGNYDLMRAVWVNDYFYILSNEDFVVKYAPKSSFSVPVQ